MAPSFKKGYPIASSMGRPAKGSMSSFPKQLAKDIISIRQQHAGWGAHSILLELEENYNYKQSQLPGSATISRFIKENGLVEDRSKLQPLPVLDEKRCGKIRCSHDQWEMDAKGPVMVSGLGTYAAINVKDRKSKSHCISFPVPVKNKNSQPSTVYYYWTLRLAFERRGLPKSIRVDHDSVFYENNTSSPFPKLFHLWLIGLGVELCFIKNKPPVENGLIERSHQIIMNQVYKGQHYQSWKQLFKYSDERIDKLNYKLPNRMLEGKPPLKKYPKAVHSGRYYFVEQEQQQIDFKRVHRYLAKGKWFRAVSSAKTISLGGNAYYIKDAIPGTQIQITFCNRRKKLLFHDVNELIISIQPIKKLTINSLMKTTTKELSTIKYKILNYKKCPLKS